MVLPVRCTLRLSVPVTHAVRHSHGESRTSQESASTLACYFGVRCDNAMYFDLNFLVPPPSKTTGPAHAQSNKGKGKQVQHPQPTLYSQAQIEAIEARIDLLVHCAHSPVVAVRGMLIASQWVTPYLPLINA